MSDQLSDPRARAWFDKNTYTGPEDVLPLAATKLEAQVGVSVCLPALNEADTIGSICATIRDRLMSQGLVDELLVIDSGSSDRTAEAAAATGATVVHLNEGESTRGPGKGSALRMSLVRAAGDIVVWLDADTRNFTEQFVTRLVAPLFRDPDLRLVKAFYERPLGVGDTTFDTGGGRVTELAVRPLINLLYPALAGVIQPLAGECAVWRDAIRQIPLVSGYGVEVALLIDAAERWGLGSLAQADLGVRIHRNRDLMELGRMSFEVVGTMLQRFEDLGVLKASEPLGEALAQFRGSELHLTNEVPSAMPAALTEEKESPLGR